MTISLRPIDVTKKQVACRCQSGSTVAALESVDDLSPAHARALRAFHESGPLASTSEFAYVQIVDGHECDEVGIAQPTQQSWKLKALGAWMMTLAVLALQFVSPDRAMGDLSNADARTAKYNDVRQQFEDNKTLLVTLESSIQKALQDFENDIRFSES